MGVGLDHDLEPGIVAEHTGERRVVAQEGRGCEGAHGGDSRLTPRARYETGVSGAAPKATLKRLHQTTAVG